MSIAVEVIDYVHSVGMELPVLEITVKDPDTGAPVPGLSAVVGEFRFKGKTTVHNGITGRALTEVDAPNGRWDWAFLAADFTGAGHRTGIGTLHLTGTAGGKAWGSKRPLVIRIKELWEL